MFQHDVRHSFRQRRAVQTACIRAVDIRAVVADQEVAGNGEGRGIPQEHFPAPAGHDAEHMPRRPPTADGFPVFPADRPFTEQRAVKITGRDLHESFPANRSRRR